MADLNLDLTGARTTSGAGSLSESIGLNLVGARADALAGTLGESETNFYRWNEFFDVQTQQVICNLTIPADEPTAIGLPRMCCRGSIVITGGSGGTGIALFLTNDTISDSATADSAFWVGVIEAAADETMSYDLTSPVAAIKLVSTGDASNISLRLQPMRNFRGN